MTPRTAAASLSSQANESVLWKFTMSQWDFSMNIKEARRTRDYAWGRLLSWFCTYLALAYVNKILRTVSSLFRLVILRVLYRKESIQLMFDKWVVSQWIESVFGSWQPRCPPSGWVLLVLPPSVCRARKGGKKTPSHPFESLPFTTQIIIYIVLETVYLVKLTFGFFKCAIKTKSCHL